MDINWLGVTYICIGLAVGCLLQRCYRLALLFSLTGMFIGLMLVFP